MRKQSFMLWLIQVIMCMIVQALGNTYYPEVNNVGIVIAIFFVSGYLCDLHNLIIEFNN